LLTGCHARDAAEASATARALMRVGVDTVIVTMGELGALLLERGAEPLLVAPFQVDVVDTTAAGDAFCGALVAALARGDAMKDAALCGCAAGALACTKLGAEPSLPGAGDIQRLMSLGAAGALRLENG